MVALASAGRVVPGSASARAAPTLTAAPSLASWWRYVDRGRAHEILAEWSPALRRMRIIETAPGAPDARVEQALTAEQPWEARVTLWLLEARLAQLGEYWRNRTGAADWAKIGRPVGAPAADPRKNDVLDPIHAPLVHHYHDARGGGDQLIAALRGVNARFVVLRAELDVPSLDVGRIDLLHPRLPDALTRSLVLREQLDLTQTGMGKLVTRDDYRRAFGEGGERRATRLVDEVLDRVRHNELERPAIRHEDTDAYAEFLVMLSDPRLLALHRRFLLAGEEDDLLDGGPVEIRKAVTAKRAQAIHTEQHLLTILEASLLAREKHRSGKLKRGDPEVRALTRLAYYL